MPVDVSEKNFEAIIEQSLLAGGYRPRKSADFNRELCLGTEVLLDFLYATQPQEWEKLKQQYGDNVK